MKETTRDDGGLRAALDTCKFVWLTGVVLWHAAGCGSAPSCFGEDAITLGAAAYVPQLLGVVMLSGLPARVLGAGTVDRGGVLCAIKTLPSTDYKSFGWPEIVVEIRGPTTS